MKRWKRVLCMIPLLCFLTLSFLTTYVPLELRITLHEDNVAHVYLSNFVHDFYIDTILMWFFVISLSSLFTLGLLDSEKTAWHEAKRKKTQIGDSK